MFYSPQLNCEEEESKRQGWEINTLSTQIGLQQVSQVRLLHCVCVCVWITSLCVWIPAISCFPPPDTGCPVTSTRSLRCEQEQDDRLLWVRGAMTGRDVGGKTEVELDFSRSRINHVMVLLLVVVVRGGISLYLSDSAIVSPLLSHGWRSTVTLLYVFVSGKSVLWHDEALAVFHRWLHVNFCFGVSIWHSNSEWKISDFLPPTGQNSHLCNPWDPYTLCINMRAHYPDMRLHANSRCKCMQYALWLECYLICQTT